MSIEGHKVLHVHTQMEIGEVWTRASSLMILSNHATGYSLDIKKLLLIFVGVMNAVVVVLEEHLHVLETDTGLLTDEMIRGLRFPLNNYEGEMGAIAKTSLTILIIYLGVGSGQLNP